ncbi:ABC transporter ATP-binding protein [Patescibacteria group bacterium]|nr:ABC transporter ATP-binding protein [Patescibacteria group bacterium]
MIEVKNVKKTYFNDEVETHALRGVSFDVKQGEFVAIMGPSGSGKSTLLHILGFLDHPTKGKYRLDGKSIDQFDEPELAWVRNQKIGFVFQMFNLLNRTTVIDNVKLPLAYAGIKNGEQDELAKIALEKVGLSHRLDHTPSQLSGGEQQRVAIARALINEPSVIFADEPTGNLDTKSGNQIMDIFSRLHDEGHTIVLITHEPYIARFAQRIINIKDGLIASNKTNHKPIKKPISRR